VDVLSAYINFCVDSVVPTKTVKTFPNNKPWVTTDVKDLINKKKAALSNRNDYNLRSVQKELNAVIKVAKHRYKEKVKQWFKSNQTRDSWKGLKN